MSGNTGRGIARIGLTVVGGMFFGPVGALAGSFLGAVAFPNKNKRDMPSAPDYPMQTCDKGAAVPVTYGTLRVAGNLVWMGPLTHHSASSGGKGGGDDDGQKLYRRDFLISVCEGPRDIVRMWKGKHEIDLTKSTDSKTGLLSLASSTAQEITIFPGDGVNEGLEDLIGEDYSKYKWDCCVLFKNYDLGASETIPMFTLEVTDYVLRDIYVNDSRRTVRLDGEFATTGKTWTGAAFKDAYGNILNGTTTQIYYEPLGGERRLIEPDGGWAPDKDSWFLSQMQFDLSGGAAYVGVNWRLLSAYGWTIYKLDLATGTVLWSVDCGPARVDRDTIYRMEVDVADNLYVVNNTAYIEYVHKYAPDGSLKESYSFGQGYLYDLWVDTRFTIIDPMTGETHTGFLFVSGMTIINGSWRYFVSWQSLSPAGAYTFMDAPEVASLVGYDCHGFTCVRTYNNLVYVSGTRMPGIQQATHDCVRVLNGFGERLAGWDAGAPVTYPLTGTQCGALCMNSQGRIVVLDPAHGKIWELSAGSLTEFGSHTHPFTTIDPFTRVDAYRPSGMTDANPADIIRDLCTNRRYGAAMPSVFINGDSFETIWQYCQENDLLISVEINSSRPLLDWIQYICSHFGGFIYWMGGKLYLGAWRNEDPEFHITRDHLVYEDGPPVNIKKRKYSETINHIELGWQSREDIYGPAVIPFRDDVDIRISKKRRKQQLELGGIKREVLANKMGWRYLMDCMYRFGVYSFRLGPKDMLLHVGQVGLLTDGFKISNQRIRITSISESKDGKNLDVEAADDISNLYPDLSARKSATTLRVPETVITSDDLADATITTRENWDTNTLHVSVTPGNAYTDGWMIYTSWDGSTYTLHSRATIAAVTGGEANSTGTTLSALPAAPAPIHRYDETLTVDIGTVTDLRTDITAAQFFTNERGVARIGNEIIGYRTAEETATAGQWKISELLRGLYQTTPSAHAIGETFTTLDSDVDITLSPSDIGKTLYIKAVAYYGGAAQSLADVEATTVTIMGHPERPFGAAFTRITEDETDGWQTDYSGDSITLYWNLPGRSSGYNVGGQDGGGTFVWGDDESLLVPQNGVAYGAYNQDADLLGVDLVFKTSSNTIIGTKSLGVVATATISKATDLGGNNPAIVEVYPRYGRRAIRTETVTITDGS